MSRLVIVGGGAAGMLAAVVAARNGHEVTLLEKNEKLGKKIYITGKGRCNLTNAGDMDVLFSAVKSNPKFLYSAFYGFSNMDTMAFFEKLGLKMKVERGNRVFPESDHASDVTGVLKREMNRLGVSVMYGADVSAIGKKESGGFDVETMDKRHFSCDNLLLATGGCSYASTGSTGDGYRFAKAFGHTVKEPKPSLVPMEIAEDYGKRMQGLALKNVSIRIMAGKKKLYEDFGEMLFTHFGISGPLILSASAEVSGMLLKKGSLSLFVDLKPALSEEKLDERLQKDFAEAKNKQFQNALDHLLPKKMIPVVVELSKIPPDKQVNAITREERRAVLTIIKNFPMNITGLRGFQEAIVTRGGVSVKEVNPSTMESKLVPHLFFAGEVLDLDAVTGGFNLQIAWSTGWLAAMSLYD